MFEIKIDGISRAKRLIAEDWPTHIISIVNEAGPDFPASDIERQHDDHHVFSFHDVEDDENQDYVVPTRQDIQSIMEAGATVPPDARLLIHCSAGKSRSTAVALGILVQAGLSPQEAFNTVYALRPMMFPNRLIVEYVDDYLGLQGELQEIVRRYYVEKIHLFPKLVEINRGGYNR